MLPEELRQVAYMKRPDPIWSGSTTSETPRLTSYNLQHYYRDDDNISIAPSITASVREAMVSIALLHPIAQSGLLCAPARVCVSVSE